MLCSKYLKEGTAINNLARILLFLQGLMCVVYGIVVAADLDKMATYMGLAIASGDGKAEMLTMYLGLSGAIGLCMLYAALTGKYLLEALLVMLITMGGITIARVAGFFLFDTGEYIVSSLLYDVPIVALTALAFFKLASSNANTEG